ncbi:MAG: hypothetical protein ABW076_04650 [Candidatus Thiodiazotropha sp.]
MKQRYQWLFAGLICTLCITDSDTLLGDSNTDDWQSRRLMHPTEAEIQSEHEGHIVIYHGLTDRQVSRAMDRQFGRIQSMMFTGIVVTDPKGSPKKDSQTGELITEDDGC